MTRQKKIYIGLAGFTGFLLILLLTFHYLGPTLVNSEWMRNKTQTIILEKTGGKAEYKTAELSLIPYIHAKIHQANFSIPGKGKGTIKTLHIIPKILPIFTGKFLTDEILIESPDIEMAITTSPDNSNKAKEPLNLDTIKDTVAKALSPLATELPEFHVNITDGRFNLVDEDETVLLFSDVQSEISCISKGIGIKMECTSNICKGISVNADFDQKQLKSSGKIELKSFQPQALINRFLPNAAYRITKPINKVSVSLKTDGSNDFQVDIDEIQIESPDIEMVITTSLENDKKAKEPFR
ncbi:MAG: AsmA family protein, partial [Planctomycetota bacterium]